MQQLNDAIENMLRETLARRDTIAPGWRDEIRAIVRNMIEKERGACEVIANSYGHTEIEMTIRKRSNVI